VGIWQQGLTFQDSLLTFTRLTIGDGLVTQLPALMISTGTGMLVSRAASMSNLGEEISTQIFFLSQDTGHRVGGHGRFRFHTGVQ